MRERYYNPYSEYNKIGVSEETQEYIRILRYIPENILVCADSIKPYMIWAKPEDYLEGKAPVRIFDADNDLECRRLFAEVDYTDIKKHSLDRYIHYINRKNINLSPIYSYDFYNSEAQIEISDERIIFCFNGAYNKNNNFNIIQDHIYLPFLRVSFEKICGLCCKLRSGTETVKVGPSSIDSKTTVIDVADREKLAEFLSGIKHAKPYYVRDHNNVIYSEFLLLGNDKLVLEFKYGKIKIEEADIDGKCTQ